VTHCRQRDAFLARVRGGNLLEMTGRLRGGKRKITRG
jgi:hypothetical protein